APRGGTRRPAVARRCVPRCHSSRGRGQGIRRYAWDGSLGYEPTGGSAGLFVVQRETPRTASAPRLRARARKVARNALRARLSCDSTTFSETCQDEARSRTLRPPTYLASRASR